MLERVRLQLINNRGNWPTICRATGIPYSWLTKFAQGKIKNPGIKRIESLDSYFRDAA